MSIERFDLEKVQKCFQASLTGDDDIFMDEYLDGYKEINKFFQLMGTVFGFVCSDVKAKIEILEGYRKNENNDKFTTFKTMIDYEKNDNLLNKNDYVSGSRTLLRLHRGLDFVREFLSGLANLSPDDKTCQLCQKAYNDTLAQFHPWLVRKGAVVAMYALPNRENLLKKVCADIDTAIAVLPHMLQVTNLVYDRTQNLYTDFDLHTLP